MSVCFLTTSSYQLFHYKWIARELPSPVVAIEVRENDFGLTEALILEHIPNASVEWVHNRHLRSLDGHFDAIVCQTPILPLRFLSSTLIVAQQYSLAKESYQYGVWRSHAHLNLMYGKYSAERVSGFSHAVVAGNPLLDSVEPRHDRKAEVPSRGSERHIAYMPTYGSLSSLPDVAPFLGSLGSKVTLKLHHAQDLASLPPLPSNVDVLDATSNPIELILEADAVISDFSGAAFDAAAAGRPLILTGTAAPSATDFHRLSSQERSHNLLSNLGTRWEPGADFETAFATAFELANSPNRRRILDDLVANRGSAGAACAKEISRLILDGEPEHFGRDQVRETTRRYLQKQRELSSRLSPQSVEPTVTPAHALRHHLLRVPGVRRLGRFMRRGLRSVKQRKRLNPPTWSNQAHDAASDLVAAQETCRPAVLSRFPEAWKPAEHREAMFAILRPFLEQEDVRFARKDQAAGSPIAILSGRTLPLVRAVRRAGAEVEDLRVRLGLGTRRVKTVSAAEFDLVHITPDVEWLEVGSPFRFREYYLGAAAYLEVLLVHYVPERERYLTLRRRASTVDWSDQFADPVSPAVDLSDTPPTSREPVDIVYTWVDSSDPDWRRQRNRYAAGLAFFHQSANNEERYINREELKFSLRSVEAYAPFVRHIYVVTAGQVPHWMERDSPRISVVHHRDIFPNKGDLPTFNSHAIEACLHRIPGLAESFLYFNDDVLLGRPVQASDFFTMAGLPKVRLSPSQFIYQGEPPPGAIPTDWAAYNSTELIRRDFGISFERRVKHVPLPLKRSVLEQAEAQYPSEFLRTRSARFRSTSDIAIPSMFAQYYGIATRTAVEWANKAGEYIYADTGRADFPDRLNRIRKQRPRFFCLNASRHADIPLDEQTQLVRDFLEQRFPFPSSFE